MRAIISALFLGAFVSALAQQPSASQRLNEKFLSIFEDEVTAVVNEAASQALRKPTVVGISHTIESVMKEVEANYGSLLTLSEDDANQLLVTGPDDEANLSAVRRDIELWKRVQLPLPAILKRMLSEVESGSISGGLKLELIRRVSEFHLRQLDAAQLPADSDLRKSADQQAAERNKVESIVGRGQPT